ncbi:MAG: hypothetical protein KDA78_17060 [Planctomycetaceae bacterium]|nr:hypothetical protein [Planctomycetaceae bacterium]
MADVYRYRFAESVEMLEVEASLLLSIWATEALHGESQTRLDAGHAFDAEQRKLVIDAGTEVGKDLNRILTGFLQREFEPEEFTVERIARQPEPVESQL